MFCFFLESETTSFAKNNGIIEMNIIRQVNSDPVPQSIDKKGWHIIPIPDDKK